MSPQNSYPEALTLKVNVFGDKVFRRLLRLNEVIKVGPSSNRISVLIRKDIKKYALLPNQPHAYVPRKGHVSRQQKGSHLQFKGRNLTRHQPYWYPNLRLPISKAVRRIFLLFNPQSMVFCYGRLIQIS